MSNNPTEDGYKCFLDKLKAETEKMKKENPCGMQGGAKGFVCFLKGLIGICNRRKIVPQTAQKMQAAVLQQSPVQTFIPEQDIEVNIQAIAKKALEENKNSPLMSLPDDVLRTILQKSTLPDQNILNYTSRLFKEMIGDQTPNQNGTKMDYFDYFNTIVNNLDTKSELTLTCNLTKILYSKNNGPVKPPVNPDKDDDVWFLELTFSRNRNSINIFMSLKCYKQDDKEKTTRIFYGHGPPAQLAVYYNMLLHSGFSYFEPHSLYRADWHRINLTRPKLSGGMVLVRQVLGDLAKFFRNLYARGISQTAVPVIQEENAAANQPQPAIFYNRDQRLNEVDEHVHANLLRLLYADITKPEDKEYVAKVITNFLATAKSNESYARSISIVEELFQNNPELAKQFAKEWKAYKVSATSGGRRRKTPASKLTQKKNRTDKNFFV